MPHILPEFSEEMTSNATPSLPRITTTANTQCPQTKCDPTSMLVPPKSSRDFTSFCLLPPELRLKIWDLIIAQPRIIEIFWEYLGWSIICNLPIATAICSESRGRALEKYDIIRCDAYGPDNGVTRAYINYDVDVVYFNPNEHISQSHGNALIEKNLCFRPEILARRLGRMPSLKSVNLVVEDICVHEDFPMNVKTVPHSLAMGFVKRDTRFFSYKRWGRKWNFKVEVMDFCWPDRFQRRMEKLKMQLETEGMKKKDVKKLIVRPIDIVRAGEDKDAPCGRIISYKP
ncbi:uncharacterized protein LY89DRAFT_744887 [Mollisia scopiformis]|uniref:2EXR domain-containing protein n=1 Tax=Mollisia scopiformis TaxID=149040 RepID=A0A194XVW6_MOLSC|nr:uncharacterized protein LY89DRAFT_744887 [Mollisia scopiformis]KUJ24159.1 hypothetical protein LY89DRAFT_744887 [Mollisia scopiformis]